MLDRGYVVDGVELTEKLRKAMADRAEIASAYVHGSALSEADPRDVDVAVLLREEVFARLAQAGRVTLDFAIPLEMEIERQLGRKVDVHVINRAPLSFRCRVVSQGLVVADNDSDARSRFEYLSRYEYFDFHPRRKEYLAEVMA
jgi:uncharacterized protein